jgi:integral membrane sensor domain MASE1
VNAIGLVGIAPFLLVHIFPHVRNWLSPTPSQLRPTRKHPDKTRFKFSALAEALGQGLTILTVLWVMFGITDGRYDHFYLSFIPIIWTAMRQGGFREYFRAGLPVTLATLFFGWAWLSWVR